MQEEQYIMIFIHLMAFEKINLLIIQQTMEIQLDRIPSVLK
jgi:hypothetical protein